MDSVITTKISGKVCAENILSTLDDIGLTDDLIRLFCEQAIETLQKRMDKCKS